MLVVKKYGNRRLYDTRASQYITQDALAELVREGADVQVVDAKSGADLTQATLAQIILEGRGAGKLLPVSLLTQLIRMDDTDLAEFMGRYVSWALEIYRQGKSSARAMAPFNPFANMPFAATSAMARMFSGFGPWNEGADAPSAAMPAPPPPAPAREASTDIADLRREMEELKAALLSQKKNTE